MVDDKLLPNVLRGDAATLRLNSTQFHDIAKNLDQAAAALSALPPSGETVELVKQLHHVAHNMAVKLPMTSTERIIIEKAAAALQRREEDGADAARYRIWRKGTASIVPSCTEQIIDDGLDAALAEARKKASE